MWTPKDDEIEINGVRLKKKPEPGPNPPKSVKFKDPYPLKSEIIPPEVGKRLARDFLDRLDGKKPEVSEAPGGRMREPGED